MEDALAELLAMGDEEEEEKEHIKDDTSVTEDNDTAQNTKKEILNTISQNEQQNSNENDNDESKNENIASNYSNIPLINLDNNKNEIKAEIHSVLENISNEIQEEKQHTDNLDADDLDSLDLDWTYNRPSVN